MTSLMRRVFFVAALSLGAMTAPAQVVSVVPPNPNEGNVITARVFVPHSSYRFHSVEVNGSVITIRYEDRTPSNAPLVRVEAVEIGALPAGTYTINVRYVTYDYPNTIIDDRTRGPFTLVVAASHFVPALDSMGLFALVAGIAAAAVFTLKR